MIYCLSIERFTFTDDMVLKIITFQNAQLPDY